MSYLTPRAGTSPCRIFLTLLACATLAGAQQNPAGTQSPRESAAPSSPNTQAAAPSQSQDEKHIHLGVIDTPFPQSLIFPSGANSDASGAGSQDHPSSESKKRTRVLSHSLLESNANLGNHPGRTIPLSCEQRRLDFAANGAVPAECSAGAEQT
jgi:hypothetical protein